jgi:hypothetical protein
MSPAQTAQHKPGAVSRALATDRLGVPAVLFFVLAGVAPLTVAAGVLPTAYATTGLTGIPAAFLGHRGHLGPVRFGVCGDGPRHPQRRRVLQSAHVRANVCEVAAEIPRVRHVVVTKNVADLTSPCAVALTTWLKLRWYRAGGQVVRPGQNSTRNLGVKVAVVGRMPAIRSTR